MSICLFVVFCCQFVAVTLAQETLTGKHLVDVTAAVQRGNTALQAGDEPLKAAPCFLRVSGLQAKHRWKFRARAWT